MNHIKISELSGNPEMVFLKDMDEALIGYVRSFTSQEVACYSIPKILKILQKDGMSKEESEEFFEYNIIGAYMGEHTPVFLEVCEGDEDGREEVQ